MKLKSIIISLISLIFILTGLVFGLFNSKLCFNICKICSNDQLSPCYFLFLFVGIIFVVSGISLFYNFRELRKVELPKT